MRCRHDLDGPDKPSMVNIRLNGDKVELHSPCREEPLVLCLLEFEALSLLFHEVRSGRLDKVCAKGGDVVIDQAEAQARFVRERQVEDELLR